MGKEGLLQYKNNKFQVENSTWTSKLKIDLGTRSELESRSTSMILMKNYLLNALIELTSNLNCDYLMYLSKIYFIAEFRVITLQLFDGSDTRYSTNFGDKRILVSQSSLLCWIEPSFLSEYTKRDGRVKKSSLQKNNILRYRNHFNIMVKNNNVSSDRYSFIFIELNYFLFSIKNKKSNKRKLKAAEETLRIENHSDDNSDCEGILQRIDNAIGGAPAANSTVREPDAVANSENPPHVNNLFSTDRDDDIDRILEEQVQNSINRAADELNNTHINENDDSINQSVKRSNTRGYMVKSKSTAQLSATAAIPSYPIPMDISDANEKSRKRSREQLNSVPSTSGFNHPSNIDREAFNAYSNRLRKYDSIDSLDLTRSQSTHTLNNPLIGELRRSKRFSSQLITAGDRRSDREGSVQSESQIQCEMIEQSRRNEQYDSSTQLNSTRLRKITKSYFNKHQMYEQAHSSNAATHGSNRRLDTNANTIASHSNTASSAQQFDANRHQANDEPDDNSTNFNIDLNQQVVDVSDSLLDDVPIEPPSPSVVEEEGVRAYIARLTHVIPPTITAERNQMARDNLTSIIKGDLTIEAVLERRACVAHPIGYPRHFFRRDEFDNVKTKIFTLFAGLSTVHDDNPLRTISYTFKHYGTLIIICPTVEVMERVLRITTLPADLRNYKPTGEVGWTLATRKYDRNLFRKVMSFSTNNMRVETESRLSGNGMSTVAPMLFNRLVNCTLWREIDMRRGFDSRTRIIVEYFVGDDITVIQEAIGDLIPPTLWHDGNFYIVRFAIKRFDEGADLFNIPLDHRVIDKMISDLKLRYNSDRGIIDIIEDQRRRQQRNRIRFANQYN